MYIKTKYNIGDIVWIMRENHPREDVIDTINIKCYKSFVPRISYGIRSSTVSFFDGDLFRTKEELLKSL